MQCTWHTDAMYTDATLVGARGSVDSALAPRGVSAIKSGVDDGGTRPCHKRVLIVPQSADIRFYRQVQWCENWSPPRTPGGWLPSKSDHLSFVDKKVADQLPSLP